MKRNKVARILAVALSAAMVFSLAACGGNKGSGTENEKDSSEQGKTENAKDESENSASSELTELSFYAGWGSSTLDDAQWFTDILAEDLGIELEVALGNGDESVFSTLLASGELTDITGLRGDTPYTSAADGDMLVNLDDYKDQLPNIFNNPVLESALNRTRSLSEDGGLYGLPTMTGEQSGVYITPKINWSTYYQLGCPEVETEDDFLNVLKQMQELEPENENGQKIYAFQLWNDWDSATWIGWINALWLNHTGYSGTGSLAEIPADWSEEPVYILDENSNYMKGLRFMFKANQMGLVDPESATQNYEQMETKMRAGCGLFDGFGWFNDSDNPIWVPFWTNYMQSILNSDRPAGYTWYFGISSKCENIDKALALLNWYFDPENMDLCINGPEGGIWEYNDEGIRVATDAYKADGNQAELEGGGTLKNVNDFWCAYVYNESGHELFGNQTNRVINDPLFNPSEDSELETQWKSVYGDEYDWSQMQEYVESTGHAANQSAYSMFLPPYTDEQNTRINEIGNIILPLQWQAVFAADEAEFEALIQQARDDAAALGVDELVQLEKDRVKTAIETGKSYGIEE